jgi:hypothetical protein
MRSGEEHKLFLHCAAFVQQSFQTCCNHLGRCAVLTNILSSADNADVLIWDCASEDQNRKEVQVKSNQSVAAVWLL